jgi:hypothetical protein
VPGIKSRLYKVNQLLECKLAELADLDLLDLNIRVMGLDVPKLVRAFFLIFKEPDSDDVFFLIPEFPIEIEDPKPGSGGIIHA